MPDSLFLVILRQPGPSGPHCIPHTPPAHAELVPDYHLIADQITGKQRFVLTLQPARPARIVRIMPAPNWSMAQPTRNGVLADACQIMKKPGPISRNSAASNQATGSREARE
jgi:hypothetical protein